MKKSNFTTALELLSILLSVYLLGFQFMQATKSGPNEVSSLLSLFPIAGSSFLGSLAVLLFLSAIYLFSLLLQQAKLPTHQAFSFWVYPLLGLAFISLPFQDFESAIALLLLVFSLFFLFRLHLQQEVKKPLFAASLLIALASLLYLPFICFFPLPILSLLWIRPFKLKEHLLVLVAFSLPYFYFYGISYLLDFKVPSIDLTVDPFWDAFVGVRKTRLAALLFTLLLGLVALIKTTQLSAHLVVRERAQLRILFVFYGLALLHFALYAKHAMGLGVVILCSAAFYIWLYKQLKRPWLFLLLFLVIQILTLLEMLDFFSVFESF